VTRVAGSLRRPGGLRGLRLLTAAATILLAVVLLGCGDDDSDDSNGDSDLPPNVITDQEIDDQDEGTPERGLLEWWQAFQFQDATAVVSLTSPRTLDDVGENNVEDLVQARGQGLQGIEILGVSESGDDASVRVGLLTFQPPEEGAPPPDEPTASTPTTFAMGKEGDEWLFDDNAYLELQIDNLKASEEAAEEQQSDEQQPQDEQQSSDESSN
jgi:hypothetical protein